MKVIANSERIQVKFIQGYPEARENIFIDARFLLKPALFLLTKRADIVIRFLHRKFYQKGGTGNVIIFCKAMRFPVAEQ
ncbi:MAG: hypothetical protein VB778_08095 [Nitrospinaceae bacterium]